MIGGFTMNTGNGRGNARERGRGNKIWTRYLVLLVGRGFLYSYPPCTPGITLASARRGDHDMDLLSCGQRGMGAFPEDHMLDVQCMYVVCDWM